MRYLLFARGLISFCQCSTLSEVSEQPPNFIIILADDLGYSDLSCYGGEIHTPHLDELAASGIQFTNFYNAARCCPTRASLLTGRYPHEVGLGKMVSWEPPDDEALASFSPNQGFLNASPTIGELLQSYGYSTYLSGKWHVGEHRPNWPVDRGFDRSYALISGAMNYWDINKAKQTNIIRTFVEDSIRINPSETAGFYSTTAYTNRAISFLEHHRLTTPKKPFFLYLGYQAPHWPLHAPEALIQQYLPLYKEGWTVIRSKRIARQRELGLLSQVATISPADEIVTDWQALDSLQRDTMVRKMATHAAMVHFMDEQIGRLVKQLAENDQLENSLILFLSDNGASAESGPLGHNFRPDLKGQIGTVDSYHSLGINWANACNAPFRKYKAWTYEGGAATPAILSWPRQVNTGWRSDQVLHVMDVWPTIQEIVALNDSETGWETVEISGRSFFSVLQVNQPTSDRFIGWEHYGHGAARRGPWKIVARSPEVPWELYNLIEDPTEQNNQAIEKPQLLRELVQAYEAWISGIEAGHN
ncbi:MAG: arylsulfatase [Bacteroidota bacterium]